VEVKTIVFDRNVKRGKKKEEKREMRGQAAIYDGITFLLLVSFSSGLVYVFVATYGQTEDSALKASYQLNYLQSVAKTFYYLDASELKNVGKSADADIPPYNSVTPKMTEPKEGCEKLEDYKYSLADLLKRDLADPTNPNELPILDDRFGSIEALGRQGARCAMKELMKPLVYSGYEYAVDVINPREQGANNFIDVKPGSARITNNLELSNSERLPKNELLKGDYDNGQCVWVQKQGIPVLSMAAPFRILLPQTSNNQQTGQQTRDYELRFCIWFKRTTPTTP